MKAAILFLFIITYSTFIVFCQDEDSMTTTEATNSSECSAAFGKFRKSIIRYTSSFLCYLKRNFQYQSTISSPAASLYLVAILGLYSEGETKRSVLKTLNVNSAEEIRCAISQFNKYLKMYSKGFIFTLNGSNYVSDSKYPFTSSFKKNMKNLIFGTAFSTNFSNETKAAPYINKKVQKETQNFIKTVVSPGDGYVTADTQILAVSAFYFSPFYEVRFNLKNLTTQTFFKTPDRPVQVPFMYQRELYNFVNSQDHGASIIEVKCVGEFAVLLILPNKNTSIECVIKTFGNPDMYDSMYKKMKPAAVQLTFPAFDNITTTVNTRDFSDQAYHLPTVNDPERSEFSGMIVGDKQVAITGGIQKFVLDGSFRGGPSPGIPKNAKNVIFTLNRPYFYIFTAHRTPIACGVRLVP